MITKEGEKGISKRKNVKCRDVDERVIIAHWEEHDIEGQRGADEAGVVHGGWLTRSCYHATGLGFVLEVIRNI